MWNFTFHGRHVGALAEKAWTASQVPGFSGDSNGDTDETLHGAVLGFGCAVWKQLRPREPQATALVANEAGAPLCRVAVAANGDSLEVQSTGAPTGAVLYVAALIRS